MFEDGELIHYGKITASHNDIGDRLYYIRTQVINLIETYNIDEVIFEDIQLQNNVVNNVDTFKKLAEVFGILEELFTEMKIPHQAVLASVWKSKLNIKGKDRPTQKRNAQAWVQTTYSIKPTQDESDAICIGAHYFLKKEDSFDWS